MQGFKDPRVKDPRVSGCKDPKAGPKVRVQGPKDPEFQGSKGSRVSRVQGSGFKGPRSKGSRIQGFKSPRAQGFKGPSSKG